MPAAVDGIKLCPKCDCRMPVAGFSRNKAMADGLCNYCKKCFAEYRRTVSDRYSETKENWRRKNASKVRDVAHKYNRSEAGRASKRRWSENNKEAEARAKREWKSSNKEALARHSSKRRAKIAGSGGEFSKDEWDIKCSQFSGACAYCGNNRKLTRQHVVPISRGGSNCIDNIVPACSSCNFRIHTKIVIPVSALLVSIAKEGVQ